MACVVCKLPLTRFKNQTPVAEPITKQQLYRGLFVSTSDTQPLLQHPGISVASQHSASINVSHGAGSSDAADSSGIVPQERERDKEKRQKKERWLFVLVCCWRVVVWRRGKKGNVSHI